MSYNEISTIFNRKIISLENKGKCNSKKDYQVSRKNRTDKSVKSSVIKENINASKFTLKDYNHAKSTLAHIIESLEREPEKVLKGHNHKGSHSLISLI
ncbi:MAG: hypothetical protein SV062_14205 [Thermodesulfobacteriota bacterium]|nr:hypothetical protein [Thermodesulfobacteriota bacterium]